MDTPDDSRSLAQLGRPVAKFPAFWMLAAFPLSLSSPGATVAMAMVSIFALYRWARGAVLPKDLRKPALIALSAWFLLILVDLASGGGANNLATVVNYLPLTILAPLAFGFRLSGLGPSAVERAMQATLLLAAVAGVFQALWLNVDRPGGLNLNPIPYGFVILVWGTFLLSSGLAAGRQGAVSIVIALGATLPILLSGSKIVWASAVVAYGSVVILWAWDKGRMTMMIPVAAAAAALLFLGGITDIAEGRLILFRAELQEFIDTGMSSGPSLGNRLQMIRSGLLAFMESPIIGYGLVESMQATLAHSDPNGPDISIHSHIHNDYVAHMAAYGLFGIVFLAVYFWLLVRVALGCRLAAYRRAGLSIMPALAIYMLADIAFNMDALTSCMAIVAALMLAFRDEAPTSGEARLDSVNS